MSAIRKHPFMSPLHVVDGQSLLRTDPYLSELSLTLDTGTAARVLEMWHFDLSLVIRTPVILCFDTRSASLTAVTEEGWVPERNLAFTTFVPPLNHPYDAAFRGLVEELTDVQKRQVTVVTDQTALAYECRGFACVVLGGREYLDRLTRATARARADRVRAENELGDTEAILARLMKAPQEGFVQGSTLVDN